MLKIKGNRQARECKICADKKKAGEEVNLTMFVKLTQHMKNVHGISKEDRLRAVSRQRASTTGRTDSRRKKYVKCLLKNCGVYVSEKKKHLVHAHKLEPGTEVFENAMRFEFVKVTRKVAKRLPVTEDPTVTFLDTNVPSDQSNTSDREEEPSTSSTPEPTETTTAKRMMTPADVTFQKWGRLIPKGCAPFPPVQQWHEFRTSRPGKNKGLKIHSEEVGYVNRFLAHANFEQKSWAAVTTDFVTRHEKTLTETKNEPGTVARILEAIIDFWKWAHTNDFIRRRQFQQVELYLQGCKTSNNKDKSIRNTTRRTKDEQTLPGPDIYDRFMNSDYLALTRKMFRLQPLQFMYDMTCLLIGMCAMFNAPRPSALFNMKIEQIQDATHYQEDGIYSIAVPDHKTGKYGFVSFFSVAEDIYEDLMYYVTALMKLKPTITKDEPVLRNGKLETLDEDDVNRMFQRGYKKAGIQDTFNLTLNRKMTTVVARENDPSKAALVAKQLCHNVATADMYYAVRKDRKSSVDAVKHIRKAFTEAAAGKIPTATVTSPEYSPSTSGQTTDEHPKSSVKRLPTIEETTETDPDCVPPTPKKSRMQPVVKLDAGAVLRAIKIIKPAKTRTFLPSNVRRDIRDAYTEVILDYSTSASTVPMETVRMFRMGRWPELSEQQLRDVVRNMVKAERKLHSDEYKEQKFQATWKIMKKGK